MATALKDRQWILAELLGDHTGGHEAVRQKLFGPKPPHATSGNIYRINLQ